MATASTLSLNNIQGDIFAGLPKKAQKFFFFSIQPGHVQDFCTSLGKLIPSITTSTKCLNDKKRILQEKKRAAEHHQKPQLLEMSGINIAFSQKGLTALNINDNIGDTGFTEGMLADAAALGDDVATWDPAFKKDIHAVILVTGNSSAKVSATLNDIKTLFGVGTPKASITEVLTLTGHTRPGDESGHEHFGFLDGVSNPAIGGLDAQMHRGQESVNQGVILNGRTGDTVARPSWALDGSFLAFRDLKQLVPEFDAFLEANALPVTAKAPAPFQTPTGADLLGARLVGRWKSGAPIDITPTFDQPTIGADPDQNDNFRYDPYKQDRCPFAAHTRKTNPRDDLDIAGGTEIHRIMRRGIQFGPEVTPTEAAAKKSSTDPSLERGLLFVSYQSNLANGFQFVQKAWANNQAFPPFKDGAPLPQGLADAGIVLPVTPPVPKPGPGIDAIIGQNPERPTEGLVGTDAAKPLEKLALPAEWVITRGGEYFFAPSISALKETFAEAV